MATRTDLAVANGYPHLLSNISKNGVDGVWKSNENQTP
jgi:hypothetical protein